MKREELLAKGLTVEQADFVMSEYDKAVNPLTAERDTYKAQLDTAQKTLEGMKGVDVAGMQAQITQLTDQLKDKDGEIAQIRADHIFDGNLKDAIRAANGRSEKAIMALLDVDALKASKNQKADIEAAISGLKKDNDYLFGATSNVPRVVSITNGINQDAQTRKEQANEALRSLFGKE